MESTRCRLFRACTTSSNWPWPPCFGLAYRPKQDQDAQFAVLDVSVGHEDLQQCADAVMRLRAEFLYAAGNFEAIDFYTEQGIRLNFREWAGAPARSKKR